MLTLIPGSVPPADWNRPFQAPIPVLLATRGPPRVDFAFNVVELARRLAGWVARPDDWPLRPSIFAQGASNAAITAFVRTGLFDRIMRAEPGLPVERIRLPDSPGDRGVPLPFDIVHLAADSDDNDFDSLFYALASEISRCRLLIVQLPRMDRRRPDDVAGSITGTFGRPVLVVNAAEPAAADHYFARLYEGLAQGQSLMESAEDSDPRISAHIGLRKGLMSAPPDRPRDGGAASAAPPPDLPLRRRLESVAPFHHDNPTRAIADMIARMEDGAQTAPTRSAAANPSPAAVESALRELEAKPGERVLNANFSREGEMLGANDALRPGRGYELLVDVGPRWDHALSIVEGHARFPSDALPPSDSGHVIDVVFASDDFVEPLVAGRLWLPDSGRSHPWVDGRPAAAAGPLALRLTAPRAWRRSRLHGRLCLYFENNLLQSATVRAALAPWSGSAGEPNAIIVDYVLTGSLTGLERLADRDLRPIPGERSEGSSPGAGAVAVGLNLTLNDDGGGGHRILIPSLGEPASVAYDPLASAKLLRAARDQLLDLFWKRNDDGSIATDHDDARVPGLDASNGKARNAFLWDLNHLAIHGSRLFSLLFANVRPPAGRTAAQWINDLRSALADSAVIQIAQTGPAQYAFPWSLVYDFPLRENAPLFFCPAVREWAEDSGRRDKPGEARCPEGDHRAHDNKICPYGFWGLRHRIEHPPSLPVPGSDTPPLEPRRRTGGQGEITLSAAHTTDTALDPALIREHLRQLERINGLRFAPPPASDWDGVVELLKSPDLLYFLCHGEYDPARDEAYIGVGLRDGKPEHRVYANALAQQLINGIDADLWQSKAPLIVINGCHTANLEPGQVWNFVQSFVAAGASGVIGTEVSVRLPVAVEAAERLFDSLAGSEAVADAIRELRWSLANKGNLIGLAYTAYCVADLKVASG